MNVRGWTVMVGTALLASACGGTTPVQPITATTTLAPAPITVPPAPIVAPSPTPAPTPTPDCGLCEVPTTSTARPVRLTLKLFTVENGTGKFWANPDVKEPIPLDYFARIDFTGKDEFGAETNGSADAEWHFSDPELVNVSGNHSHQRRLKVLKAGTLDCWVTQEGATSNVLTLRLGN
jgi:hypothetical protein